MLKRSCIASLYLALGAGAIGACSDGADTKTQSGEPAAKNATAQSNVGSLARPAWATDDRFAGMLDKNDKVTVQVHLAMRNMDRALAELAAISDRASPRYGQFLSDAEFLAKYAPNDDDIAAVRAHLEASGLSITHVPASKLFVSAEGTASAIERAFATALGAFRVGAETRHAPMRAASLPAHIASRVVSVIGLSTPHRMKPRAVRVGGIAPDDVTPDARVCSPYFGGTLDANDPPFADGYPSPLPYVTCGFTPPQIRKGYGLDEAIDLGIDGRGRSVAIVDAYLSPTLLADAQAYATAHDPSHPLDASQLTAVWAPGTPTPVEYGWYGEQALDVQAVHAVAPGADIVFVGAQSANDPDLIAAITMIVDQHLASIVSNSYGDVEQDTGTDFASWRQTALHAGLKGVGLYFSSGDSGDEAADFGKPSADFPASLDIVTAVGGTSLALGQNDVRLWETGWQTGRSKLSPVGDAGTALAWTPSAPGSWVYGSGGGVSVQFEEPWYQRLFVPRKLSNVGTKHWRVVPDVAMLADPVTGFIVGQTSHRTGKYAEGVIGGTSLACPLFAATMALGEQLAGRSFGFANPILYGSALIDGLRDVRPLDAPQAVALGPGSIATFNDDAALTIHTARGYDDVTGLGTPRGLWFLATLP